MLKEATGVIEETAVGNYVSSLSTIKFFNNSVIKEYHAKSYIFKVLGKVPIDVDWEIDMQRLFKSKHSFSIDKTSPDSYSMPRFSTSLGDHNYVYLQNLKKILSLISVEDLLSQLDEIARDLESCHLKHYDIHPGNLLFSQSEKIIKLSDFGLCNKHMVAEHEIYDVYGRDDKKAIELIKCSIRNIVEGKGFLNIDFIRRRTMEKREVYLRNNYKLIKKDKEYLFRFYKVLGKDGLLVDRIKSRRYLLKALLIKPYDLSILSKLFRSFRNSFFSKSRHNEKPVFLGI